MLPAIRALTLCAASLSLSACTGVGVVLTDAGDATGIDAQDHFELDAVDTGLACNATRLDWGGAGDLMFPGSDCIGCHREGGSASRHVYTVAGTVFTMSDCPAGFAGATVHLEDSAGHTIDLTTNAVGNFHTATPLVPPLHARVTAHGHTLEMHDTTTNGSCNACHNTGDGGTGWISANPL